MSRPSTASRSRSRRSAAPAAALAVCAFAGAFAGSAQAQLALDWRDGRLGSEIEHLFQGGANQIVVLLPSSNAGPTPLSLVDPLDPRFFEVGLDLLSYLTLVQLDALGAAKVAFNLAPNAALAGVEVHWHAVALGASFPTQPIFGALSNSTRHTLLLPGQSELCAEPLQGARRYHTANEIPGGPLGSTLVLMAGGESPNAPFGIRQDWEIVDPSNEEVVQGGPLLERRTRHAAVTLLNGRVLIVGGIGGGATTVLSSAELYLPNLDLVQPTTPMAVPRVGHTATRLADGRVLVVGGLSDSYTIDHPLGYPESFLGSGIGTPPPFAPFAELFDPSTNTWTPIPSIGPRTGHEAVLLGDGTVLIAGGLVPGPLLLPTDTESCLRFDPLSLVAVPAAPLPNKRAFAGMSPESSGGALLAGGGPVSVTGSQVTVGAVGQPTLRFDRVSGTWNTVAADPSAVALVKVRCIRMPDGSIRYVLIECPDQRIDPTVVGLGPPNVYVLVPGTAAWSFDGSLLERRFGFTATSLDDRTRFLIGGSAAAAIPGGTGALDRTLEAYPYRL
jgi:hypothetical protein